MGGRPKKQGRAPAQRTHLRRISKGYFATHLSNSLLASRSAPIVLLWEKTMRKSRVTTTDGLPEVGPWDKEKLERLRKYLTAYTKIMSRQTWAKGYVYIDAFAGAGRSVVRSSGSADLISQIFATAQTVRSNDDARQVLNGSPRVALEIEPPFTDYVFLERDPARVATLQALSQEYVGTRRIFIRSEDCNSYLAKTITKLDWKKWRGVVFLDPFGMQVPWKTIEALAQTGAIEVFLNFPVGMSIQRLLRRDASFTAKQREKLDSYFGDPSWFDVVYPRSAGLFGAVQEKAEGSARRLVEWYCERLKKAFGHVSNTYLVSNSHGGHLYFLVFAGPNKTGAAIASSVLRGGIKEAIPRRRH